MFDTVSDAEFLELSESEPTIEPPKAAPQLRIAAKTKQPSSNNMKQSKQPIAPSTLPVDPFPDQLLPNVSQSNPYPIHALGPLSKVAQAIQNQTQASIAIIANSLLAAASLATQHLADVEMDHRRITISLFILTIAESGERKSAVDQIVLSPVKAYQTVLMQKYTQALTEYKNAQEALQIGRNKLMAKYKDETNSQEHLTRQLNKLTIPTPPRDPKLLINDITYDGLLKSFHHGQPSQGLFNDDGGNFFGGHAMNKDNRLRSAAGLSKFWDGDDIQRTRAAEGETMLIKNPRLTCHLMIQPSIAESILSDPILTSQGFLARYLIAAPESLAGTRLYRENTTQPNHHINDYHERLQQIIRSIKLHDETQTLTPRALRLDQQAKTAWIHFYNKIEREMSTNNALTLIKPTASKQAEQALRIAGVLTLFENTQAEQITENTMKHAITLAEWYLNEALRLTQGKQANPDYIRAQALIDWLQLNQHQRFTKRLLQQKAPRSTREHLKSTLQVLLDHNWIYPLPAGTLIDGKAPRESWRLNNQLG